MDTINNEERAHLFQTFLRGMAVGQKLKDEGVSKQEVIEKFKEILRRVEEGEDWGVVYQDVLGVNIDEIILGQE